MLRRAFTRTVGWFDDRLGVSATLGPMLRHLAPHDARWWYVFGSATLCAFMIQVASGVALAFAYIPSAGEAYSTLQFITHNAPFGNFMRGLHYFGASAMVLMVGLHMAQVFLFGSYKFPREMNWATGVLLLGFTLLMGFTGQLLRWDQTAVWTVVVAAEQVGRIPLIGDWVARFTLGGYSVGGATLNRFFAIHVFIVPGLMFAFIGLHVWLVLRHGISEPPKAGDPVDPKTYRTKYEAMLKRTGKPFWPDAAWRDVTFAVAMIIGIAVLALVFGPPQLGKLPDPSIIEAYPRPDWYLLWYFAVLALLPHGTENIFMIFGPVLAGLLLIALPFIAPSGERSPNRRPWAVAGVLLTVTFIGALWIMGEKAPWSPNFSPEPLTPQIIGATQGPVFVGAHLFETKACLNCHLIQGHGGRRGPDLTYVGDRLRASDMIIRIVNGGNNMPAFGSTLKPAEIDDLVAFLKTRVHH
jgi:ubiquinol-cytochrome c reductase cytochrome b subunit